MGLFSRKKVFVDTSVQRIIEDKMIPDMTQNALIRYVMKGGDIIDNLNYAYEGSMVTKVNRGFRYAAKGKYTYGLPSGSFINTQTILTSDPFINAVKRAMGTSKTGFETQIGPLNLHHLTRQKLKELYGYNDATNSITYFTEGKERECFLLDVNITLGAEDVNIAEDIMWGPSPLSGTAPMRPPLYSYPSVVPGAVRQAACNFSHYIEEVEERLVEGSCQYETVTDPETGETSEVLIEGTCQYETVVVASGYTSFTLTVPLDGFDLSNEYVQVVVDEGSAGSPKYKFWYYHLFSGGNPTIDDLLNPASAGDSGTDPSYMPFILFRQNGINLADDSHKDTDLYKTSTKLCKYFSLDYKRLGAEIYKNPGIGDIEQAAVMMGIPLRSTKKEHVDYNYNFFRRVASTQGANWEVSTEIVKEFRSWVQEGYYSDRFNYGEKLAERPYHFSLSDGGFRITYEFGGVNIQVVDGDDYPVGHIESKPFIMEKKIYSLKDVVVQNGWHVTIYYNQKVLINTLELDSHMFIKQLPNGEQEIITLYDPRMIYHIRGGHSTASRSSSDKFLVPIDYNMVKQTPFRYREVLYASSFHLVVNSYKEVKLKWYQIGIFKVILSIVAIGLAIFTGGQSLWALYGTLAAAATVSAVLVALASTILEFVIMQLVYMAVVELLGEELAMLLSLATAMYSFGAGFLAGGLGNAPFASELLRASTGLASYINAGLQDDLKDLQNQINSFNSMANDRWAEVEKGSKLLEKEWNAMNPLGFVGMQPLAVFGETPTNYFNRTISSGNIGSMAFDFVEKHAEISLTLPQFNQTIGEF